MFSLLYLFRVPQVTPEEGSVDFGAWHHCTQTSLNTSLSILDIVEFPPKILYLICPYCPFIVNFPLLTKCCLN